MASMKLGVDVGGTFTDFALMDPQGRVFTHKRLTTPADPVQAVLDGLSAMAETHGIAVRDIDVVIHGSTLITNALIERKGARTALITTQGFRDILEMGTELRYDVYDLHLENPTPLVPRRFRLGIRERLDAMGNVVAPVDPDQVRAAAQFFRSHAIASVAITFLHSYANPVHEVEVKQLLREEFPDLDITISSAVSPEMREYERTSTAVANAYVQPIARKYLASMQARINAAGSPARLSVVLSNGGIVAADTAASQAIRMLESGPAAGVRAAGYYGQRAARNKVLSFDMGGTTAKMCLVNEGDPALTNSFEAARMNLFKKGSGLPLRLATIDLIEIGAGGGSVARVDSTGLLKVGPDSAGSEPGPACYQRGGSRPTVTDANLSLGFLDARNFLGGSMHVDARAANEAIEREIAGPLNLTVLAAARGIVNVVNNSMATATRLHIAERGEDPRSFTMVAFGGAGPVHAYSLARLLRIGRVMFPMGAGVASAIGMLVARPMADAVRAYLVPIEGVDLVKVKRIYEEMAEDTASTLGAAGVTPGDAITRCKVDMRYVGQAAEVSVELPREWSPDTDGVRILTDVFEAEYRRIYGRVLDGIAIEAVNWRLIAEGPLPTSDPRLQLAAESAPLRAQTRLAHFAEFDAATECQVLSRYSLTAGAQIDTPALVEERESTLVLGPGTKAWVDGDLNVVMDLDN